MERWQIGWLGCAGAACALLLAGGCAFTGVRREPQPMPASPRYVATELKSRLRNLPVSLELEDFNEMAMVNRRGFTGGTSFAGTFPVRVIVAREFSRLVDENFRQPLSGEPPAVLLKIISRRIVVQQKWSKAMCDFSFDVQMLHPTDDSRRPYFRRAFRSEGMCTHKDDEIVPASVYEVVQQIAKDFMTEVAKDGRLVEELERAIPGRVDPELRTASLRTMSFTEGRSGVFTGICEVDCNDWEGFQTDKWARSQIEASCQMKLGVEHARMRIVYTSDRYDSKARRWTYGFKTFVRAPLVMDYDHVSRTGVCLGDLDLLGETADVAAVRLKEYVRQEMAHRGGAISTADDAPTRVDVRFDAFRTDVVNNLIQISFRVVY